MSAKGRIPVGARWILLITVSLLAQIPFTRYWRAPSQDLVIVVAKTDVVLRFVPLWSSYMVYTDVGEPFEIRNDVLSGKFDSAELYGKLLPGCRYRVRVKGTREPMFGMYRNIVEVVKESSTSN